MLFVVSLLLFDVVSIVVCCLLMSGVVAVCLCCCSRFVDAFLFGILFVVCGCRVLPADGCICCRLLFVVVDAAVVNTVCCLYLFVVVVLSLVLLAVV